MSPEPGDELYERGMRVRREVLGDAHVDAAVARTTDFTADFQELITKQAWGGIWSRPGLDRRMRSAITLTALVALGRERRQDHLVDACVAPAEEQVDARERPVATRDAPAPA